MKAGIFSTFILLGSFFTQVIAQNCGTAPYQQEIIRQNENLGAKINSIENFIKQSQRNTESRTEATSVIRIPVVVHILYHYPPEKTIISDERVQSQLDILNAAFRRRNADTSNTPSYFKPFAADCEIEFALARSDSRKRSTTGIIRKYSPIITWTSDDKIKFTSEYGDDAWDTQSYLNIWICNLDKLAGYASFPGGPADRDGIVMDFDAVANSSSHYGLGKTAIHEAGHWLGLKHLWGDQNCGDDGVDDTPKQASYTPGCPTGPRITCNNGPNGDMYMDYMDFTSDQCMNMFTLGQKNRMRALFSAGGPRYTLLTSKGFDPPLIFEAPVTVEDPKWLHPQLYPVPANSTMTLNLDYDPRWIGQMVRITNLQGQAIMDLVITSKVQLIDVSRLSAGMYILAAKKADGESLLKKFIKQ